MKKVTITVSYDEEKLSALKLYLGQKDSNTEDELTKALDTLYTKTVPAGVREFIDLRSSAAPASTAPKKKPKPSPLAAVGAVSTANVKDAGGESRIQS